MDFAGYHAMAFPRHMNFLFTLFEKPVMQSKTTIRVGLKLNDFRMFMVFGPSTIVYNPH